MARHGNRRECAERHLLLDSNAVPARPSRHAESLLVSDDAMSLAEDERREPVVRTTAYADYEIDAAESRLFLDMGTEAHPGDRGEALRRARLARGLSIQDLTRLTKIRPAVIEALESNDRTRLPTAVFTRGFVKAYAREVGLDADRTAAEYLAGIQSAALPHRLDDGPLLPPHHEAEHAKVRVIPAARPWLTHQQARRLGRFAALAAMLGLAIYIWSFAWQRSTPPGSNETVGEPASTATTPDKSEPPASGDSTPSAVAATSSAPSPPS